MRSLRPRKLNIALVCLLPYLILSVGSELTHNHAGKGRALGAACAASTSGCHVFGHGFTLSVASFSTARSQDCPACALARTSVSGTQAVSTTEVANVISDFVAPEPYPIPAGRSGPVSSRAPPTG